MLRLLNRKNYLISVVIFLAIFFLSGCSDYSTEKVEESPAFEDTPVIEDSDSDLYDQEPQTFNGYECTDDCSGHEAGYNWAEEKGITDPSDCGGNSNSFIEGCESYAEGQ
ncbi:MAG: hypothetical protein UX02_C0001G0045 [Candidatus Moranbacteria bacterium GW2011_GWC1_45_18]|nr:MAG: hypothetical protein UT79_C0002G0352 [Candidatus Moranbacteria bacterium GW2011_GWC2_40_12]KKT34192.1 MAG: hypothetical protein UW19_C0001G0087 [Candidatus Moranbacteria bacterium GW2011_GWF2_44_10]KKU00597.1 MAG: hypothetical protein UX02_C0001G0045 [Candidatus Moranbacteria bacterium GW2011_GWC1_45_18]